jgi:hypothetical protein
MDEECGCEDCLNLGDCFRSCNDCIGCLERSDSPDNSDNDDGEFDADWAHGRR